MHEPCFGASASQGLFKRMFCQLFITIAGHRPSYYHSRIEIQNYRQVKPSLLCLDIRNICGPLLTWLFRMKITSREVERNWMGFVSFCRGYTTSFASG